MKKTIKCTDKHLLRVATMLKEKGFEQKFNFIESSDLISVRSNSVLTGFAIDSDNKFSLLVQRLSTQEWDYTLPADWDKVAALQPKPEIKEGQYWELESKYIVRIEAVEDDVAYYTFVSQYAPVGQHSGFSKDLPDFYTLLTDNEVEEVLIEEAKKRGFPCKKWEGAKNGCKMFNLGLNDRLYYSPDQDELRNLVGSVYYQGNWGEPIKEENIYAASGTFIFRTDPPNEEEWKATWTTADNWCVTKNKRKINNIQGSYLTQQEAEKIAEALNK